MDVVEKAYRARMNQLTGLEKVARVADLLAEIRAMLRRRIESAEPHLDELGVQIRIAESLYRTDRLTLRLLQRLHR